MSFAQLKKSFLIKDILDSDHERNGEHSCLTCSSSDCCPSNRASIWSSLLPHEHNGQSNWTSTTALYGSKDHGLYGLYCAAVAANCGLELEPQQNDQNLTADCENSRKVRRNRTVFTELQLMGLERRFDSQKYLSTPDRAELARALGLTQLQVKTWYQNRRMKWKKQVMQNGCPIPPTKPKGRPKKNSIPSLGLLVDSSALLAVHALQQCNNKNTLHTGLHY